MLSLSASVHFVCSHVHVHTDGCRFLPAEGASLSTHLRRAGEPLIPPPNIKPDLNVLGRVGGLGGGGQKVICEIEK